MFKPKYDANLPDGTNGKMSRRKMLKSSLSVIGGFTAWANIGGGISVLSLMEKENKIGTQNYPSRLHIVSRTLYETRPRSNSSPPKWHKALYSELEGTKRLIRLGNPSWVSEDNGCTWTSYKLKPDITKGLPAGYRRNRVTSVVDPNTGWLVSIINSLDTPGLDPKVREPAAAVKNYYLRYQVSKDGGRSWAFQDPIVGEGGFTLRNPFDGIHIGKNCIYLGDIGCIPIVTREEKILVPTQTTLIGATGNLYNPGDAPSFTDVLVLIGSWNENGWLVWQASNRVKGRLTRSTRGMIEPTLAEMPDGRILMVMRGSNGHKTDPNFKLPSYRWYSISEDGGKTWPQAEPWTYDGGEHFYSPSSMSTLFKHSTERVFWVGNITKENSKANSPRWPLVMGEVDPKSLQLIRDSIIEIDTRHAGDKGRGRVDIEDASLIEDRENGDIVLTHARYYHSKTVVQWEELRISVKQG